MIEVFNTAKRFQKKEDTSKYVSVVVLDEVGLAEDSPNLPLKALHPLLEDGTEGADNKEVCESVRKCVGWVEECGLCSIDYVIDLFVYLFGSSVHSERGACGLHWDI